MRTPLRGIHGQLLWTTTGRVWAWWRVHPSTYRYLMRRAKLALLDATRAALLPAGGEVMLLSVAARVSPAAVGQAMVDRVDLEACSAWAEVVDHTLDALDDIELHRRYTYIGVELPGRGGRDWLAAAGRDVAVRLGLPPTPVSAKECDTAARQAADVGRRLERHVDLHAASAAELVWLQARAPRRGLDEPPAPEADDPRSEAGPALLYALDDAVLTEGGGAEASRPLTQRRHLRVDTAAGSSFQAFACLADVPRRFVYPDGGEWFLAADAAGFPVDWCARIRPQDNRAAQQKVKRQRRELAGQLDQHDTDAAGLEDAAADAVDEAHRLESHHTDPELHTTLIYACWADTREECESRAAALAEVFDSGEFALHRPTGGQLGLFQAMQPGAPTSGVCRHYTQYFLPSDLAGGAPFAGSELGDPHGALLGFSMDAGTAQPVLADLSYGPRTHRSGALAVLGDLGAGKSQAIKHLTWTTVARNGAAVLLDRSSLGEYVHFARTLSGQAQIVRLTPEAEVSLDPLRVFTGDQRIRTTKGLCTLLTGHDPRSAEGLAVAEAVTEVAHRSDACLADVVTQLHHAGDSDAAASLAGRQLDHLLAEDLAQLLTADSPPLRVGDDAAAVVFHLPGLALPDKAVVENEQLAKRMLPEQVIAQALLYLAVAVMRHVAFDLTRFAVPVLDEAGFLTASLEGRQLLGEILRDSRKHAAAPLIGTQNVTDLPSDLAGLVTNRLLFRTGSSDNAAAGLRFLDLEPGQHLVDEVRGLETGQCLLRDVDGRIGRVALLAGPTPDLAEAFTTTPLNGHNPTRGNEDS